MGTRISAIQGESQEDIVVISAAKARKKIWEIRRRIRAKRWDSISAIPTNHQGLPVEFLEVLAPVEGYEQDPDIGPDAPDGHEIVGMREGGLEPIPEDPELSRGM